MTAHDSEEGEFRSRQCAGQAPAIETRFIARVAAAGAVRGEEFSALFPQRLAAQTMEILRRGRRIDNLNVVPGAQL